MDTFFEQIVSVKKSVKDIACIAGIWFLALTLCFVLVLYPVLANLTLLSIFGILYGAYKLSSLFNIEYEYIITNGIMDVDKIINKSSRKRVLSLDLEKVSRLEKYNPALISNINRKSITVACSGDGKNSYLLVCDRDGKPASYLIFSPDERIKSAIVKFVPKFIANSAFK